MSNILTQEQRNKKLADLLVTNEDLINRITPTNPVIKNNDIWAAPSEDFWDKDYQKRFSNI